jgi:thiol-disulfide isomerase/thioredoxin
MQKVVLVVVMVVLTLGCGLGYVYKKSQGSRPGDSGPGTNWIWNNDWMNPGSPGPSPTPPDTRPPVGPVNPGPGTQLTASTYREAVQLASKEGKPVLAFFTASWCTWCQKMKQDTLVDPTVTGLMKNYVYVAVDVDKEKDVARKYNVTSIPAYVITNGKEENLKSGKDYMKAPEFAVWLNNPNLFTQPKVDGTPPPAPPKEQPKQQRPPLRRQPQQQRPPQDSPPGS